MQDIIAAGPRRVIGFLAGIVEAVLRAWSAVQVDDHFEVGVDGPAEGLVEVCCGAENVGLI